MANLNPLELEQLKLLLSGKALPTEAQISILDILRSRFPDFLTALPDITKENLKDNKFLIRYFANPYNRNKIKNALRSELPLSTAQEIDLEQALSEKLAAAEEVNGQPTSQAATPATGQEAQPIGATGSSAGDMSFGGMPSAPSMSSSPRMARIIQNVPPTPEAPKPEIVTANKTRFSGFKSSVKNFGSRAGVFFQRNIGKHLTGDRAISLLGKAGNTGINALSGITNLGGRPGGVFSSLGRFSSNGGGRGFFGRFGKGGGQGGSLAGKAKGRGGLIFAAGLIGFMLLVGMLAMSGASSTPGQAAPINNPNNFGLDYTLPLRDPTIQPLDIKSAILSQFPKAQIDNWDIIVQKSIDAGWNPALVLALWIEESGAQGKVDNQGNPLYDDPLGCAPKQKTTDINISLKCLFDNFSSYTNDQFITFMTRYGGGTPGQSLAGNDNFPKFPNVVKDWYSKLVPSGAGAIVAVAPSSAPQQQFVTSCPIRNGKITCGSSKGAPGIPACHCTDSYSPRCDPLSRRGKAIDVTGPNGSKDNDPVYIPLINGRPLKWYFRGDFDDGYHATLRVFQSEPTPDGTWTIHFVHSKRRINLLKIKDDFTAVPVFSSGQEITDLTQPVAYTDQNSSDDGVGVHTHVSIGLLGNVDWQADQLQYLNQGWKYADVDMRMCQ